MPGTIEFAFPFGGDFVRTPNGDMQQIFDTDQTAPATTQRMLVGMLTIPILRDANGNPLGPPDDIFHPGWGAALPAMADEELDVLQAWLTKSVTAMAQADPCVSGPVTVLFTEDDEGDVLVALQGQTTTGSPLATPSIPLSAAIAPTS